MVMVCDVSPADAVELRPGQAVADFQFIRFITFKHPLC